MSMPALNTKLQPKCRGWLTVSGRARASPAPTRTALGHAAPQLRRPALTRHATRATPLSQAHPLPPRVGPWCRPRRTEKHCARRRSAARSKGACLPCAATSRCEHAPPPASRAGHVSGPSQLPFNRGKINRSRKKINSSSGAHPVLRAARPTAAAAPLTALEKKVKAWVRAPLMTRTHPAQYMLWSMAQA